MQLPTTWPLFLPTPVSILTRPGGRVQPNTPSTCLLTITPVSILTRPGGRVQPDNHGAGRPVWQKVSILTRPGGRVQRSVTLGGGDEIACFNPHPTRRPGATLPQGDTLRCGRCFNPHPTRRPGATAVAPQGCRVWEGFQSSPDPEAGCNAVRCGHCQFAIGVSILTRPGGRVQPSDCSLQ